MLHGFEIFYRLLNNVIKTKNEAFVAILHYIFINQGFKCVGSNEQFSEDLNIIGSELLPEDWNSKNYFILQYINSKSKDLVLFKIIPSENLLLINALFKKNDKTAALTLDPNIYISDNFKNFDQLFKNEDSIDKLIEEVQKEIFNKSEKKKDVSTSTSRNLEESSPPTSILEEGRFYPNRNLNERYIDPNLIGSVFPQVGNADLDPLGRGIGGGMVLDPRSLEHNFRPGSHNYRPGSFSRFDPSAGLERPLPPGAVPPGARFEPFGPVQLNRNRRNSNHPDLEQPPSDYDDMFM